MTAGQMRTTGDGDELRRRLAAIAGQVPVAQAPPLASPLPAPLSGRAHRRVLGSRPVRSLVAVAASVAVVAGLAAAIAAHDGPAGTVEITGPAVTTDDPGPGPVPPGPCVDTATGDIVADGDEAFGAWQLRVADDPMGLTLWVDTPGTPGGGGGTTFDPAEVLDGGVPMGTSGWGADNPARVFTMVLPPTVVAVRAIFADGHQVEVCTVGRALGLGVVAVAVADAAGAPVGFSAVDADGYELFRADPAVVGLPDSTTPDGVVETDRTTVEPRGRFEQTEPRVPAPLTTTPVARPPTETTPTVP